MEDFRPQFLLISKETTAEDGKVTKLQGWVDKNGVMYEKTVNDSDVLLYATIQVGAWLYMQLGTNAVKPFACLDVGDGSAGRLVAQPSEECAIWSWTTFFTFPVLLFYGLGIPLFFSYKLFAEYERFGEDAMLMADDPSFRDRWAVLTNYYVPEYFYWESVNFLQKLSLPVIIAVLPNDNEKGMALALCMLVLTAFMMGHMMVMPYDDHMAKSWCA